MRAAGIASSGIEREAANRLSIANDVGDHRNNRRRHFGEIETRIGERRLERNRRLADVNDTHSLNLRDIGVLDYLAPLVDFFLDVCRKFIRFVGDDIEAELGTFLLHVRQHHCLGDLTVQ